MALSLPPFFNSKNAEMKPLIPLLVTILFAAALTGCSTGDSVRGLSDTKWQLKGYVTSISPELKKARPGTGEHAYMLEFMNNAQTYGWGEKNSIGGKYKISGSHISFQDLVYTQSATEFQDESIFFDLIGKATEYVINNQELYLYSEQKRSYLLFEKQ